MRKIVVTVIKHLQIEKLIKFAFATILLFCTTISFAQSKESSFKRFGFQIGVNLSNMNFNEGEPPPAVHANSSWQTGITFGFQLKVPLAKKWLLQSEYSYSRRNGSDQTISTNYKIDYFSFPLLIDYQLSPRFNILAGPQFEITMKASSSTNDSNANITHDVEERSIGVVGGLEFTVLNSIFISEIRYQRI